jgi:hypothetical protein
MTIDLNVNEINSYKSLWRAVVSESINALINPIVSEESIQHKDEVIKWVYSDDFETVCDYADLNPDIIKKVIIAIIQDQKNTKKNKMTVDRLQEINNFKKRKINLSDKLKKSNII